MPKAKGEDLRWLVVYKRVVEELPIDTIALECRVCPVCRACLAMNVSGETLSPTGRKARRTPPALAPRADTARTSRTTNDLRGGVGGPEDKHVYAQRTARCGEVWRGLEQSAWLSTATCCVPSVECARSVTPSAPPASALPATCPTRAPLVARRKGLPGGGLKPTVKNTETWTSISVRECG